MRRLFQWSDEEDENSGYASSVTVSSVRTDRVSVNMADNDNDDLRRWLEAQEQTSKAQQEILDNIQQMLAQLRINWNNNDTESNEEEHHCHEQPKTEKSKESSFMDAEVLKGIQAQITSLAQREELNKVGTVRPYPFRMGFSPISAKVQATNVALVWWQELTKISTFTTSDRKPVM